MRYNIKCSAYYNIVWLGVGVMRRYVYVRIVTTVATTMIVDNK